jgi:protein-disulfide isomerase-like protein with CxxC motif
MSVQLFYIYDTHCPWSYVTLPLVNEIMTVHPEFTLNLLHCARYEGDENISKKTIESIEDDSSTVFSDVYMKQLKQAKDSTLTANVMSWVSNKVPQVGLELVNLLFKAHFEQANELRTFDDISDIVNELKLSPPNKVFTLEKFTKDAEISLSNLEELQEIMGTKAIPAILMAIDEELILLNHNLYLKHPKAIVEAVELELNK